MNKLIIVIILASNLAGQLSAIVTSNSSCYENCHNSFVGKDVDIDINDYCDNKCYLNEL